MKKKNLVFILVIFFLVGGIGVSYLKEPKEIKYDFANFTTEDAMNFIREEGIRMPTDFEKVEGYEEITLDIIMSAYESPEFIAVYSHIEMYEFASQIIDRVHFYLEE